MDIQITKQIVNALTEQAKSDDASKKASAKEALKILSNQWNIDENDFRYGGRAKVIDISKTPHSVLTKLADGVATLSGTRGYMVVVRSIKTWLGAAEMFKGEFKPAKSVQAQELMLRGFFAKNEIRRVYMQDENENMRAYYAVQSRYHPAVRAKDYYSPPYITLELAYRELGVLSTRSVHINEYKCLNRTPLECLKAAGIYYETDVLRAAYLEEHERWHSIVTKVGHQCIGRGSASENVDGNKKHSNAWYWRNNVVSLDPMGEPSRVVIDVLSEEENGKDQNATVAFGFWDAQRVKLGLTDVPDGHDPEMGVEGTEEADAISEDEDEERNDEHEEKEVDESRAVVEVPDKHRIVVFDMNKHRRVSVHVSQLDDYVYDTKMGSKLILPAEVRDLLHVLLTNRTAFLDVIAGKGGGASIMCFGPPGTGKTLTAEVYAEVMKRPLYAVQTSQLGMDAPTLEDELRRVFARAQRWGAILLLDEADVYVRARGDDLEQNAIVGVFLRTMEYFQGVMFLTTNRMDLVDDAILSRCIARIAYNIPHPDDQKAIWRVQADTSKTQLSDAEIDNIVAAHSDLSGRDIKNLLKLARMIATYKNVPVDAEMITFVKRFKPTGAQVLGEYAGKGGALVLPTPVRKPRGDDE